MIARHIRDQLADYYGSDYGKRLYSNSVNSESKSGSTAQIGSNGHFHSILDSRFLVKLKSPGITARFSRYGTESIGVPTETVPIRASQSGIRAPVRLAGPINSGLDPGLGPRKTNPGGPIRNNFPVPGANPDCSGADVRIAPLIESIRAGQSEKWFGSRGMLVGFLTPAETILPVVMVRS